MGLTKKSVEYKYVLDLLGLHIGLKNNIIKTVKKTPTVQ
jgi:hypothetical protein